jgi:hypothetical protein
MINLIEWEIQTLMEKKLLGVGLTPREELKVKYLTEALSDWNRIDNYLNSLKRFNDKNGRK